jgi:hypothetical protein
MKRRFYLLVLLFALFLGGVAGAQFPILDMLADKVVQKYQQSTCEQLWLQKSQPKPPMEQQMIQTLRNAPEMRLAFINRVAAPIANKMFECGMIHDRRWATKGSSPQRPRVRKKISRIRIVLTLCPRRLRGEP